jgi:hypothetical protein
MGKAVCVVLDGLHLGERVCCLFDSDLHCGTVTRLSPGAIAFCDDEGATWEVPRGWIEKAA